MRAFWISACFALAWLPQCNSAPAARVCTIAPPQSDFHLTTNGTALIDSLGRVVFLRGVDAGGRSKFAPYVPFDFTDENDFTVELGKYMDRASSWGIDAMRVPFTWAALEPVQGQDDATWLAHYDAFIDAAWAHGIWSVVDFHQDVYAENFCGDGFPSWTIQNPPPPAHDCPQWSLEYFGDQDVINAFDAFWANSTGVQTAYMSAWDVMVARYKDRPGVVGFEPINEPAGGSQDNDAFTAGTLTNFYSMMVPHMRALAPSSLVFVDPSGLDGVSQTTGLNKPTGDGIVFAPHFYPLSNDPDVAMTDMQKWQAVAQAWNVPTFVGEFGASNQLASTPAFMQAIFDSLDALALSGTEWEYSVSTELWNDESDTLVDSSGNEYPVAQAVIRPFARAVAGTAASIVTSFDATSGEFALRFTPNGGATNVTVVSLPARAYPNGFDVDLAGGCYDATSAPGELLVQADPDATFVGVTVAPK